MPVIKLSKDAAIKAQKLTRDVFLELEANNKQLNDQVSLQMMNLNDTPSRKKYDEMMMEIQSLMSQLRNNFNDINDYCDRVIRWIDEYNSH